MFENVDVQEAIKRSIQTEKNARDFYRLGARHMRDERARKTFELLAGEEAQHARMFWDIYSGSDIPDFDAFMAVDPLRDSDWLTDLEKELVEELDVRRAMRLAMDKELKLEAALRSMAAKMPDERAKEVLLQEREIDPPALRADRIGIRPSDGDGARDGYRYLRAGIRRRAGRVFSCILACILALPKSQFSLMVTAPSPLSWRAFPCNASKR